MTLPCNPNSAARQSPPREPGPGGFCSSETLEQQQLLPNPLG